MASRTCHWIVPLIGILLVTITVLVLGRSKVVFSEGTGDPNDPNLIETVEDLLAVGSDTEHLSMAYILMADLDLSSEVFADSMIAGTFEGTLDGNGHSIRNLVIETTNTDSVGLFSEIGQQGTIRDLILEDCQVLGRNYVGGLTGVNQGLIQGCTVNGTIIGDLDIVTLCGVNAGIVRTCHGQGTVQGEYAAGGLVGCQQACLLDSGFTGDVQAVDQTSGLTSDYRFVSRSLSSTETLSGTSQIGGLAGQNFGLIEACLSQGTVQGEDQCGGLVGYLEGRISHCASRAEVIGRSLCGGLVGKAFSGLIRCSYATGPVVAEESGGGLVGENYEGTVYLCYWPTDSSGQSSSAGGRGLTTASLMARETYIGWGWGGLWTLDDGCDLPRLTWEQAEGTLLVDEEPKYQGGTGEPNDPYQIGSLSDLTSLFTCPGHWVSHFVLTSDLDANDLASDQWMPVGRLDLPFTGLLDGQDHRISNLIHDAPTQSWIGLFGVVGEAGVVRNVRIEGFDLQARDAIGSLAGLNLGLIEACEVEDSRIQGEDEVGGLVGRNQGQLTQCSAQGQVNGQGLCMGSLAGSNLGTVEESIYEQVGCDWQ